LRNNRQVLEDELAHALEFLHSVDKGLEQLETREVGELLDADALIRLKREYGEIARQSAHWTNVSRSETDLYVKDLERQRGDTILTIEQLEQRGQELAQEIEEYRRDIGDVEDGDVTMLIQSISDLEAAIGEIDVESDLPVIPESQLASAEEAVSQLEKLCVLFYDLEIRLIDSATLRRKRHWLETRHRQMLDYSRQLQSVSEELASLVDQQKIMFKDIPTEPCAQMACPLYAAFMSEAKTSRRRTEELQERKRFLIHFVRRLTRYTDGVSAQIDQMQRYLPDVMAVARIIKDYPQFDAALKGQPLTERLMQNPSSISRYARDTLTHSQSQVEKARLENELERARILYEKVKSVTDRDSGYLKQMVGKRETSLSTINLQIKQAKANLNSLESDLSNARDYLEACQRVVSITSRLENSIRETEYRAEADTLKALRSDICRVRDDRISKLGEIDHAIKRQDILKARYTEEVVAQMEIIEKTRSELMSIESALSPINGLPHGYTVQFLNHVIRIANLCIQEVFSYPFEVIPLSEDSDLDYRFQVKAGDAIVPDVSHCSAAQKEMIDFAFCLALIEVVDVRGYPIMLDEIGSAFDHRHQHQLLNLLQIIMTEERASSMFLVNHNEAVLGGLANAETLVLNDLNIIVPEDYNHHATINYIAESPA
jgi:ribosome-binding protein aMBF1 (putative translation factor)